MFGQAQVAAMAQQIDALVTQLHEDVTPVEDIAWRVCKLNGELFARLWSLLARPDQVAQSCLIVMGSEGRGEQILKTDQDNALLWRDGADMEGVQALAERFTEALIELGYPRCPGNIMLSNPQWRQPLQAFKQTLRGWMFDGDAAGAMNLAIFLDAAAVAGDRSLLQQARGFVDEYLVDNDIFFARFASAVDQFEEPGGWWSRLAHWRAHEDTLIDLKKHGTFVLVHGVRALALEHHVQTPGTAARLRTLAAGGHLPAEMAKDLIDALHSLIALKLDHQLSQRQAGVPIDNLVSTNVLAADQRERLNTALATVRAFRQHLRLHYRFDAL